MPNSWWTLLFFFVMTVVDWSHFNNDAAHAKSVTVSSPLLRPPYMITPTPRVVPSHCVNARHLDVSYIPWQDINSSVFSYEYKYPSCNINLIILLYMMRSPSNWWPQSNKLIILPLFRGSGKQQRQTQKGGKAESGLRYCWHKSVWSACCHCAFTQVIPVLNGGREGHLSVCTACLECPLLFLEGDGISLELSSVTLPLRILKNMASMANFAML